MEFRDDEEKEAMINLALLNDRETSYWRCYRQKVLYSS